MYFCCSRDKNTLCRQCRLCSPKTFGCDPHSFKNPNLFIIVMLHKLNFNHNFYLRQIINISVPVYSSQLLTARSLVKKFFSSQSSIMLQFHRIKLVTLHFQKQSDKLQRCISPSVISVYYLMWHLAENAALYAAEHPLLIRLINTTGTVLFLQ